MNSPDIADNQQDQAQKAYRTLPDVLIHDGRVFIEYEYIKKMMAEPSEEITNTPLEQSP